MTTPGLQNVADRAGLYALLKQALLGQMLAERFGRPQSSYDSATGTMTFHGEQGTPLTVPAHLIAFIKADPSEVIWGWGHPKGAEHATSVRELGERHGITDLTTERLPYEGGSAPQGLPPTARMAHLTGSAAIEATRRAPYYMVDLPGSSDLVSFLLDVDVPEPTLADAATRMQRILSAGFIANHRSSVLGLAEHRAGFEAMQEGPAIRLHDGNGEILFVFDPQDRIIDIRAQLGA